MTARLRAALSLRRVSALYVLFALIGLFSIWVPDTFLTTTTLKTLLAQQAITAMVAIGLVLPLAAGAFDLSVGLVLGTGAIVCAWLVGTHDQSVVVSISLALGAGLLVGVVNGLLVTRARIDSFIATLGVSACLTAVVTWISDGQLIIDLPDGFQRIATTEVAGIVLPVYYLFVLAIALWFVLEHTPVGRRVYATGGNSDAARLAGVRTTRVVFGVFVASAVIASFAGVLQTASIGTGDPGIGPSYLLPAFAAAFLGSTQIKPGRFNVWGTVLAVYVLATGVKGLQLAGAPFWLPDLFNGVALLLAVGLSGLPRRSRRSRTRGERKTKPSKSSKEGATANV